jgi:hypothetical protein
MGLLGWDELQDGVKLQGLCTGGADYNSDDGDWSFSVDPAPEYQYLLTNPDAHTNKNGLIECEVEPPNNLNGDDAESKPTVDKYLNNGNRAVDKKWVTVVGTWTRDRSHAFEGGSLGPGEESKGKTEIHPITSILVEYPPEPANHSRVIEFFVFSSEGSAFKYDPGAPSAPHTDENRLGACDVMVPREAFTQLASFAIVSELDMSDSKKEFKFFFLDSGPFYNTLHGQVNSGKASEGKGFYWAKLAIRPGYTLRTYLFSRGVDPKMGIRKWMSDSKAAFHLVQGASSVRSLFDHV